MQGRRKNGINTLGGRRFKGLVDLIWYVLSDSRNPSKTTDLLKKTQTQLIM